MNDSCARAEAAKTDVIRNPLYIEKANQECITFLVGLFHSYNILDPKTGNINIQFIHNINEVIKRLINITDIEIKFVTLSQAAKKLKNLIKLK